MRAPVTPNGLVVEPYAGSPAEWDAFVEASAGGTFCHLMGWRGVLERDLGNRMIPLCARDATGALVGVLPLGQVESRLFGRYLVSMPFLNYGGPIGTPEARRELTRHSVGMAQRLGVGLLELRGKDEPVPLLEASARKIRVVLDLPPTSDELWTRLTSKLRNTIRRPQRDGLEVRFGPDELDSFYAVFARNMRDLGTPVLPKAFFRGIVTEFGSRVTIAATYREGEPVAAGLGFHFGDEFEITWASSLREMNRYAGNMLLYWRLMEDAIARGARTFNFGRCTPGGGTHQFKRNWTGSRDVPLTWAVWSPNGKRATPSPDAGRYGAAVAAWQRLPLPVANRLGPLLSRRIP